MLATAAAARGRRTHSGSSASGCGAAARRRPRTSRPPQAMSPIAIRPGNHAGPYFWPVIGGKPWMCQSTTAPSAASAAPVSASLNFTSRRLLRQPHGLHGCAEVGIGLGHELCGVRRVGPDDAETPACHEFLVLLGVVDLLQRRAERLL